MLDKKSRLVADVLSLNAERLDNDEENFCIDWLLQERYNGNDRLEDIKDLVLCMNKEHSNYEHQTLYNKAIIDMLHENEHLVNVILVTIFQWFGTGVGMSEVGELLDKIRTQAIYGEGD